MALRKGAVSTLVAVCRVAACWEVKHSAPATDAGARGNFGLCASLWCDPGQVSYLCASQFVCEVGAVAYLARGMIGMKRVPACVHYEPGVCWDSPGLPSGGPGGAPDTGSSTRWGLEGETWASEASGVAWRGRFVLLTVPRGLAHFPVRARNQQGARGAHGLSVSPGTGGLGLTSMTVGSSGEGRS